MLPAVEPRLVKRYQRLVREHMSPLHAVASGLRALPAPGARAFSSTQGAWRFLANERVSPPTLAAPLLDAARQRAADGWHSSRLPAPDPTQGTWRLDALAAPFAFIDELGLPRPTVHLIDREADSVAHYRAWAKAGHRFVVRADDRLVRVPGQEPGAKEQPLRELVAELDAQNAFERTGDVIHRAKACWREVAGTRVLLTRPAHSERRQKDGSIKRERIAGEPLELRLVVARLREKESGKVAAQWYVWRWQIESYFKLLKSSGHHLESWGQQEPQGLLKRLLVTSMACVLLWSLARDQSPSAKAVAALLARLSGRQTKRSKPITDSATLAGLWSLLGVLDSLEDYSLEDLRAAAHLILGKLV